MDITVSSLLKVTMVNDEVCLLQFLDPGRPLRPEEVNLICLGILAASKHFPVACAHECPFWVNVEACKRFAVIAHQLHGSKFTVQTVRHEKYIFEQLIDVPESMLHIESQARVGRLLRRRMGCYSSHVSA